VTEPTPTPTPVPEEVLVAVRRLHERDLIDKLPPEKRAKAQAILQSQFKVEREDALKPKAELLSRPSKPGNFVDELLAPIKGAITNPVDTMFAQARGVERAYNPLSLVGVDLEDIEGAFNFPIIRGAELAARLFVDDDQQPDLTTFSQVVKNQIEMDRELRNIVPGVQEGTELGAAVAGVYQLGSTALKLAPQLARKGKAATLAALQRLQQLRADKQSSKAQRLGQELLRIGQGPFMDAIIKRPEAVAQLVKQNGDLSINDVAIKLKDEIETISTELGKRVGTFREAASADTTTRIAIPQEVSEMLSLIRQRTTFANPTRQTGKAVSIGERLAQNTDEATSILPGDIQKRLMMSERAAKLGVTNPNQAMVWVDMLDDIIDYANSGKPGSTSIKNANALLMRVRGTIKNALRSSSDQAEAWAAADDAFSGFIGEAGPLIRRLETDGADSLVANLFGQNKTPIRMRLEKALDYMEKIDPTARGAGNAFFARLADIKAAGRIQDVQMQINDPIQDNINRIVSKYRNAGKSIGRGVGFSTMGGAARLSGADTTLSGAAAGGGWWGGEAIGGMVGEAVGKRIADPMRVINAAIKSKQLSKSAMELAKDLEYVTKTFGPAGAIAFFDIVGPIPAVKELVEVGSKVRSTFRNEKEE